MSFCGLNFEIVEGETEGISYTGIRKRRKTILIRVGNRAVSKHAFQLGFSLILLEIIDGIFTYIGLSIHGIDLEGNGFLADLMVVYGLFPALLACKLVAIALIIFLTYYAHRRRWIRPFIYMLCAVYITMAVLPWAYILTAENIEFQKSKLIEEFQKNKTK